MNINNLKTTYDINSSCPPFRTVVSHDCDVNTRTVEVRFRQGVIPLAISKDCTAKAIFVERGTNILINDNVPCTITDSGSVLIPVDDLHRQGGFDMDIEVTIANPDGNQVLVTPFPLWIHVNASILDDAEVMPESQGTVPELLEEAKEALETVGDYENLENKPQINGHELVGDKSSDDLGLQGKLTAGENVTIDANGRISATGGTDDYEELNNKPSINNVTLSGNKTADDLGLQNKLIANEDIVISQDDNISIKEHSINFKQLTEGMSENLLYSIDLMAGSTGSGTNLLAYLKPNTIVHVDFNNAARDAGHLPDPSFNGYFITLLGSSSESVYIQIAISFGFPPKFYIRCGSQRSSAHRYYSSWKRLNIELSSAAVNQNGTITFTMSDGSTVTTTGESVIGPQGDDYVLTAQDKTDIANIVLSELPTTQGVQYGNTSN